MDSGAMWELVSSWNSPRRPCGLLQVDRGRLLRAEADDAGDQVVRLARPHHQHCGLGRLAPTDTSGLGVGAVLFGLLGTGRVLHTSSLDGLSAVGWQLFQMLVR